MGPAAHRPAPHARIDVVNDDVSDWAAALTYYAILALLPALLVTVSVISLVSPDTTEALIAEVTDWAPAESGRSLHTALSDMADARSAALTVVIAGAVSAVWSASSYSAVFQAGAARDARRGNVPAGLAQGAPGADDRGHAACAARRQCAAAGAQRAARRGRGRRIGVGDAGQTAWGLLKWPALVCLVALLVLVLFRNAPPSARGWRRSLPGGLLAALLWLVSSALFTWYASGFGSYGKLYGSLAGVVVFLVWLWMSNLALLAGAQYTVELARVRPARPVVSEDDCADQAAPS
ncbi:YihY/virulence factor BrkB family protein OS=Streptomyces alboniger OX=132473 GN=CP975_01230 PE=4 SV=1 [Streptomyces alboniger]